MEKTTLSDSETFERTTTAAASEFGLVWRRRSADSCQRGDWRMETTSPGLSPYGINVVLRTKSFGDDEERGGGIALLVGSVGHLPAERR